jgi:phage-related protein
VSNVGYATLTIIPSAKGFGRALAGETSAPLARAGAEGGAALGGGILDGAKGLAAAAAGVFAAVGVGSFLKDAVGQAADLEQSVGAIETVFKGSADQMLGWSKSAATAVGLTQNEYNELGTLIGTQLKNGGTATDELAGKTNDLIGVGADLSSMFGGSTSEAVEALSSALKGERDPIERYGVSLTQAAIDAKAAEMGFKKVGGSLDAQANQAATLALIMDQTADAHGNFGRETDTLSHKQQVLNAMWENGKTSIGQALLPAVSGAAGVLISVLGPALDGTVSGVTKAMGAIGDFVDGFQNGVDAIGSNQSTWAHIGAAVFGAIAPIAAQIGSTVSQVWAAFSPFLSQIGGALAQLAPAFGQVLPSISPFGIILQGLLPILPQIASFLGAFASDLASTLGPALVLIAPLLSTLASTISGVLAAALPQVLPLITALEEVLFALIPVVAQVIAAVLPLVTTLIAQLAPIFMQLVASVLPPVIAIIGMLAEAIGPLVNILLAFLVPAIQALMPVVTTVFGVIVQVITAALQIVQGIIQVVTGIITGNWSQVWSGILNILSGVWNLIKSVVTGALAIVGSVIRAALGLIAALWSGAWAGVKQVLGSAWEGIKSGVSSGINAVVSFLGGLGSKVLGALSGAGQWLVSVGRNIIEGLLGGIQAAAGRIKDAVLGPIKNSVDAVKSFLGIHSPSRLFREIGGFTGEGMALGLEDSAPLIAQASKALIPDVPDEPYVPQPSIPEGGYGSAGTQGRSSSVTHVTLQSTGSVKSDLDEVNFYLRTKDRGGRFA